MSSGNSSTLILEELSEGAGLMRSNNSSFRDATQMASIESGTITDEEPSCRSLEERNRILMEHLPQVHYIARRIHDRLPRHVPFDDLVHSGVLGLMEALHNYDPSKNVQLKSYAKVRIRGAILDSLRELDWSPRTLRRKARQIENAHHALRIRLGRTPCDSEIAAELGIGLKKFQRLIGELHGLEVVSLHAMPSEDGYGEDGSIYFLQAVTEDSSDLCLRSEMNGLLARAVGELPPRKRQVLALYYFEELTMKEVGARMGVGESRVSQIHSAALVRLRVRMRQLLRSRCHQKPTPEKEALKALRQGSRTTTNAEALSASPSSGHEGSCDWEVVPHNLYPQFASPQSAPQGEDLAYSPRPRHASP